MRYFVSLTCNLTFVHVSFSSLERLGPWFSCSHLKPRMPCRSQTRWMMETASWTEARAPALRAPSQRCSSSWTPQPASTTATRPTSRTGLSASGTRFATSRKRRWLYYIPHHNMTTLPKVYFCSCVKYWLLVPVFVFSSDLKATRCG